MSDIKQRLREWARAIETGDPNRQMNHDIEAPTLIDAAQHIEEIESFVEGCSSRNASYVDRIAALEAPYKLVSTPPSEPGWYWMATDIDPAVIVHVRFVGGELCADMCPLAFYSPKHKWGSAPLPIPEIDDE